jgi:hypothetical protein
VRDDNAAGYCPEWQREAVGVASEKDSSRQIDKTTVQERLRAVLFDRYRNFTDVEPGSAETELETSAGRAKQRDNLHKEFREVFIVHSLAPSTREGYKYEIFIYLKRRHDAPLTGNEKPELNVEKAEFFFGSNWGDRIYKGNRVGDVIGVRTAAYRPFLCTCLVTFENGYQASLYRRIDFEMGDLVTKALEAQPHVL